MLNLTNLQTKGYDELIEIDGEIVYQVFAIKRNNGTYSTYYYTVPKNKLDQAEDYEIEEFNEFNELELAIKHIQSKGANLSRFNIFKDLFKTIYQYDCTGNLIHRELADGEVQNYFYDLHDQLVKAEIFKKDGLEEEPGAVIHFLNKSNGLNVITKKSDDFISGWKLNSSQLQNVVSRGAL